ncbi:hypothetical protein EV424DRAFT_1342978 [Suillus variegatus]|nr:hypothetical protein EV424DRAFT_1342978 [Suillus variegatus]
MGTHKSQTLHVPSQLLDHTHPNFDRITGLHFKSRLVTSHCSAFAAVRGILRAIMARDTESGSGLVVSPELVNEHDVDADSPHSQTPYHDETPNLNCMFLCVKFERSEHQARGVRRGCGSGDADDGACARRGARQHLRKHHLTTMGIAIRADDGVGKVVHVSVVEVECGVGHDLSKEEPFSSTGSTTTSSTALGRRTRSLMVQNLSLGYGGRGKRNIVEGTGEVGCRWLLCEWYCITKRFGPISQAFCIVCKVGQVEETTVPWTDKEEYLSCGLFLG